MEYINKTRVWFDNIPTPAKIIFYSGLSLLVAKAAFDAQALSGWYAEYVAIAIGIITNLIAWKLLQLKEE